MIFRIKWRCSTTACHCFCSVFTGRWPGCKRVRRFFQISIIRWNHRAAKRLITLFFFVFFFFFLIILYCFFFFLWCHNVAASCLLIITTKFLLSFFLEKKINYLFPIQSETFDYIYDGQDIIGQASKSRVVYVSPFYYSRCLNVCIVLLIPVLSCLVCI